MQVLSAVCFDEHQKHEYERGYKQGYNKLEFTCLTMYAYYGYEDGVSDRLIIEKSAALNNNVIWNNNVRTQRETQW
jgi:hypothetical protein